MIITSFLWQRKGEADSELQSVKNAVKVLQGKSAFDLWNKDLDNFLEVLEKVEDKEM